MIYHELFQSTLTHKIMLSKTRLYRSQGDICIQIAVFTLFWKLYITGILHELAWNSEIDGNVRVECCLEILILVEDQPTTVYLLYCLDGLFYAEIGLLKFFGYYVFFWFVVFPVIQKLLVDRLMPIHLPIFIETIAVLCGSASRQFRHHNLWHRWTFFQASKHPNSLVFNFRFLLFSRLNL